MLYGCLLHELNIVTAVLLYTLITKKMPQLLDEEEMGEMTKDKLRIQIPSEY